MFLLGPYGDCISVLNSELYAAHATDKASLAITRSQANSNTATEARTGDSSMNTLIVSKRPTRITRLAPARMVAAHFVRTKMRYRAKRDLSMSLLGPVSRYCVAEDSLSLNAMAMGDDRM